MTEMKPEAAVGHPGQYYTTAQEKGEEVSLYIGQQHLAGISVQPWNAWSQASKMWSPPGILLGLTKDRRKGMWLLWLYHTP